LPTDTPSSSQDSLNQQFNNLLNNKTGFIFSPRVSSPPLQMNLRSATYITAKEVRNEALDDKTGFKDKNNVTTNTNNESKPDFDSSDNDAFDLILGGDYDAANNNMEVN
jgi:hypothetical protein